MLFFLAEFQEEVEKPTPLNLIENLGPTYIKCDEFVIFPWEVVISTIIALTPRRMPFAHVLVFRFSF